VRENSGKRGAGEDGQGEVIKGPEERKRKETVGSMGEKALEEEIWKKKREGNP